MYTRTRVIGSGSRSGQHHSAGVAVSSTRLRGLLCAEIFLLALLFASPLYSQDYVVGERDVLKITVYDNPDLTTTAKVSEEGSIFFPFLGEVKVKGLTTPQIAAKISSLLAEGYIVNPQVSVYVEQFRSLKIMLIGEIARPGLFELPVGTTLLELLLRAGPVTPNAGNEAIIKRKTPQGEQSTTVDFGKLLEEGDTTVDQPLQDGDNIYIPKGGSYYVLGQVKSPGMFKFKEQITVFKAVVLAGGFTEIASQRRISIKRKQDGKEVTLEKVGLDELVKPDDIVNVPESLF